MCFTRIEALCNQCHFFPSPSKGLHLLCRLYVGRSYHLWKEPRVLPWLEANVTRVLDRVDSQADEVVQDCAEKRKVRYQGTPRNVYRHVLISELKEVTVLDLPWVRPEILCCC